MDPTSPFDLSAAALRTLLRGIEGEVLLPDSADYERASEPQIARFAHIRPSAVVRCRTADDVARTLAVVRRQGLDFAVRSGGHCFAGRSSTSGILTDVGPMHAVSLSGGVARVGAGARLGEVYDALDRYGVTIAGGCGPTVGIAGLALGGGLGILGRRHGLTCDQLVGAQVVTAGGGVIDCDRERDPELFWALRGAGAGRFGVVTELALGTVAPPATTTVHLTWPAGCAAALIAAWQAWSPEAPDEAAISLLAIVPSDTAEAPSVHLFGAMLAGKSDTTELVEELISSVGVDPASARLEHMPFRAAKRYLADHGPGDASAESSATEPTGTGHAFSKSEFFRRPLPGPTIGALAEHLVSGRVPGQARTLDFTPWAGAYNRVPADATAFVHRAERFLLKHEVVIDSGGPAFDDPTGREWLARSWALVHPSASGGVYPNFPDPDVDDAAYFGANLPRIKRVKEVYDPTNVFRGSR